MDGTPGGVAPANIHDIEGLSGLAAFLLGTESGSFRYKRDGKD